MNGHFIDELWDICPYCPAEPREPSRHEASREMKSRSGSHEGRDVSAVRAVMEPPHRTVVAPKPNPPAPAGERFVVGWLVGLNGAARGEAYPVRMGRNVIGRSSRSDIIVGDEQASSHHADIVYRPDERRFILMDHNSTNGTFVNGAEIAARKDLASRDIIRVGKQKFMFQAFCDATFGWDDEDVK